MNQKHTSKQKRPTWFFWIILVLACYAIYTAGLFVYGTFVSQWSIADKRARILSDTESMVTPTKPPSTNTIPNKKKGAQSSPRYVDTEYQFSIELTNGFEGFWTEKKHTFFRDTPVTYITFYVDATGTTWPNQAFEALMVGVYPKDWVAAHTEDGSALVADGAYLGSIIPTNHPHHAFTYSLGHDCPGIRQSDGTLTDAPSCELRKETTNIIESFTIL